MINDLTLSCNFLSNSLLIAYLVLCLKVRLEKEVRKSLNIRLVYGV